MTSPSINENARLELLRGLAAYRDYITADVNSAGRNDNPACYPTHVPLLGEGARESDEAFRILAAQESIKLGHVEGNALHGCGDEAAEMYAALAGGRQWMVRITDAGYDWIKKYDAESSRLWVEGIGAVDPAAL